MEPLAERLRPRNLDEYIGQKHLVGQGAVLRRMIDSGHVSSFILWGPPGVGKTTLAQIVARKLDVPFYTLSAVTSGVKDVRDVIQKASQNRFFNTSSPILFIDEIHRFSKSQQDSLLGAVEKGVVTLIGATTENPSFEVIRPLLSRCQLYVLKSLDKSDLEELLQRELRVSPLAAQTYSKSYRYFCRGLAPSYIDHGEGCYIYDVDGNKFIDYMCALGPITVGYNVPSINEAVIEQAVSI